MLGCNARKHRQIDPCTKVLTLTAQYDHSNLSRAIRPLKGLLKLNPHRCIYSIGTLRPVQSNIEDMILEV